MSVPFYNFLDVHKCNLLLISDVIISDLTVQSGCGLIAAASGY